MIRITFTHTPVTIKNIQDALKNEHLNVEKTPSNVYKIARQAIQIQVPWGDFEFFRILRGRAIFRGYSLKWKIEISAIFCGQAGNLLCGLIDHDPN